MRQRSRAGGEARPGAAHAAAEERSQRARHAALARWAGTPAEERSRWARRAARGRWRYTLARVAAVARRDPGAFGPALREFYREVATRPAARLIADEPPETGRAEHDAYLAAVAEAVARLRGWVLPDWAFSGGRVLSRPWFCNAPEGMKIPLIQQAEGCFRRRNIFVPAGTVPQAIAKAEMELSGGG